MSEIKQLDKKLNVLDSSAFQPEATKEAITYKEALTQDLLKILDHSANNPKFLKKKSDFYWFTYASLFLAQFREKRAYPLFVKCLVQQDKTGCSYVHQAVIQKSQSILASICQGDIIPIKKIIEDSTLEQNIRIAAIDSLVVLYINDQLTREELVTYFQSLFETKLGWEKNPDFWSSFLTICALIYPRELYYEMNECFNLFLNDKKEAWLKNMISNSMKDGKEKTLADLKREEYYQFVDNAISEIQDNEVFVQGGGYEDDEESLIFFDDLTDRNRTTPIL